MKIITESPEKIVLRMDANDSLTNAIRRSLDEVSVLAVDEVEFSRNDSALYDEMVAHRIGLIPLKTDKKMNSKTEVNLTLKKSGPCTVYSGDLKGNAEVVEPGIPITMLEKGQEIELVATARLGKTAEHSKHACGLCYYRQIYNVKSKNPKVEQLVEGINSLVKEKQGTSWLVDLKEAQEEEIDKLDKEAISDSGERLFFVESYGQMKAKDILFGAIEALEGNLNEIEKVLK